jgi:hypothetical protein
MKGLKVSLVIMAVALLTVGLSGMAYAFHSGGVAECGGCHSMHSPAPAGSFLLVGSDPSSACMTCHEHTGDTGPSSYHISTASADMPAGTAPLQRTPGGDFGWLKKTYTFTVRGTTTVEDGATHGHNIQALDFGYGPVSGTAPGGGTFPAAQLSCTSCHDPHGQFRRLNTGAIARTGAPIKASGSYSGTSGANEPDATSAVGVYRLLAGLGYQAGGTGGVTFTGAPAAKVPSSYNRTEAATPTRVAYGLASAGGAGHVSWGTWCSTCHPNMHSGTGNYVHPVDQNLGSTVAANYNAYVKTGDVTGAISSSFTSLVPFSTAGTYTELSTLTGQLTGPEASGATSQVTCLSCHRAHASGWEYALRWNMEGELLTVNGAYPLVATHPQFARGRTQAEIQAAYYDRAPTVFATYQRVLCNKCHTKD